MFIMAIYWISAGLASFTLATNNTNRNVGEFVINMVFGGVLVPARILVKVIK